MLRSLVMFKNRPLQNKIRHQPATLPSNDPSRIRQIIDPWRFISIPTLGLAVVVALTAVLFSGALRTFFFQDDFTWLIYSRFVSLWDYLSVFSRFNRWGTYRPLGQETFFWLGQKVFGLAPAGYHVVALLVHVGGSALLYTLLRRWCSPLQSLAGALFYAIHPAHASSLYWLSAFPEPLAVMFYLASMLLFLRSSDKSSSILYGCSLFCMILGLMSKESILSLPLVLSTYCLLFTRTGLVKTVPFHLLVVIYAVSRLTSPAVRAIPYGATFGIGTVKNLLTYLAWTVSLPDSLFVPAFDKSDGKTLAQFGVILLAVLVLIIVAAPRKKYVLFGVLWYFLALQPVLYFSGHLYSYYLASALPGVSLLIASVFPPFVKLKQPARWFPALAACLFWISASSVLIRKEDRLWSERSASRRCAAGMVLEINSKVPDGATAYLFGITADQFAAFENGGLFRLYEIKPQKFMFVFPPYSEALRSRLLSKRGSEDPALIYCFEIKGKSTFDVTRQFRYDPTAFMAPEDSQFAVVPGVRLVATPHDARRGLDDLTLQVDGLHAKAIDVVYTVDGNQMPPVVHWLLDDQYSARVFVDGTTPTGLYRFIAIRDSDAGVKREWIAVNAEVRVR